jgi:hypothetical protein
MEPLVDRTVSFRDVLVSPEPYKGRVLGGGVLKAKRLHNRTPRESYGQRQPGFSIGIFGGGSRPGGGFGIGF